MSKVIVNTFQRRNPTWTISPKVVAGRDNFNFKILKRHARNAIADSACDCTVAHAACDPKTTDHGGAIDAMVQLTHAHLLIDKGDGKAQIVRYRLSEGARSIVDANDRGVDVFGFELAFVPPVVHVGGRRVTKPHGPQTKAHLQARIESRHESVGRRLLSNS